MTTLSLLQIGGITLGIIALAVVIVKLMNWEYARYVERYAADHPPISDEEYLRRCHTGVNVDIALQVRAIISQQSGIPEAMIYPESRIVEVFGEL